MTHPMDDFEKQRLQPAPKTSAKKKNLDQKITRDLEEIITRLNFCLNGTHIYSLNHPTVAVAVKQAYEAITPFLEYKPVLSFQFTREDILYDQDPLLEGSHLTQQIYQLFETRGIQYLQFIRGLESSEIQQLIAVFRLGSRDKKPQADELNAYLVQHNIQHIRFGGSHATSPKDSGSRYDVATNLYEEGAKLLESVALNSKDPYHFDVDSVRPIVHNLIEQILDDDTALLTVSSLKSYDNYLFSHSLNVSILSLCFSLYLRLDHSLLLEIGLGALLHDIGKMMIPIEILHKPEPLTDDEWTIMKRHPLEGTRMILHSKHAAGLPALIVFSHHQRVGSDEGYPITRRKMNIHPLVSLVSICDGYDAMTTHRPYGNVYTPSSALAAIKDMAGTVYDPDLVRLFEQMIGPYPIGTLVRLNTGELGIILRHNSEDIRRPYVKVIEDANGNMLKEVLLYDLAEKDTDELHHLHTILDTVDPQTVPFSVWDCL